MMNGTLCSIVLLMLLTPASRAQQPFGAAAPCPQFRPTVSAERFEGLTYLTGRATLRDEVSGDAFLTANDLLLAADCTDSPALSLDLRTVDSVRLTSERRDPSVGARLAVGLFAPRRDAEVLHVFARTAGDVEVLVFRVSGHQGAGLAAKMEERRRRLSSEQ